MSDGGAWPPSAQSSSYSLTTLSSYVSTDRRAVTDRNGWYRRGRSLLTIFGRLRRRECCMLGAPSSQPTVPLNAECSIEVGHISVFMHPATLAVDNGRAPHIRRAPRGGCCSGGRSLRSCTPSFGLGTTKP